MTTEAVETKISPRLKTRYAAEIKSGLQEEFGYTNVNQVPRLVKVVVNMGVGDAAKDSKLIDGAVRVGYWFKLPRR
jgi:large subunit ribosomal protein L5